MLYIFFSLNPIRKVNLAIHMDSFINPPTFPSKWETNKILNIKTSENKLGYYCGGLPKDTLTLTLFLIV